MRASKDRMAYIARAVLKGNYRYTVHGAQQVIARKLKRKQKEKIAYTQTIGDKVYIVENVPVQACPECGEQYLSPDVVDAIQEVIEKGKALSIRKVPVFHLPQTAF